VETGLAARAAIYRYVEPGALDPRRVAFHAVTAVAPQRVLDVGCGTGEFAGWLAHETSSNVVGLDLSERMVELTRQRDVDAVVGDVQYLPFHNGAFDCVTALWMLFHVPDLNRALVEIARALRPGGSLVAVTNGVEHLHELFRLLDVEPGEPPFSRENGERALRQYFSRVERRDINDWLIFPDRESVMAYTGASLRLRHIAYKMPADLPLPFRARRAVSIFTAETSPA